MALDIKKFLKGIGILNASDQSKRLTIQVADSSSPNTNVTLQSSATANRTVTLPDASGTVLLSSGSFLSNRAVVTDPFGSLSVSPTSSTEIGYVDGVTGPIQTQIDGLDTRIDTLEINSIQNGANLGSGEVIFAGKSGTNLNFKTLVAGTNVTLTPDGTSITISSAGGTSGANTTLSNLTSPTAINQNILPDTDDSRSIGSVSSAFSAISSRIHNAINTTLNTVVGRVVGNGGSDKPSGGQPGFSIYSDETLSGDFAIFTDRNVIADSTPTNTLRIETGNKTAGTGNSGNIVLQTGTSVGGSRGSITLNGTEINASSSKIINVANPTNPQDAATKDYVDSQTGPSISRLSRNTTSGTQSISDTTNAQLNFATSVIDTTGGEITGTAPWEYTAAETGYLKINIQLITNAMVVTSGGLGGLFVNAANITTATNTQFAAYYSETSNSSKKVIAGQCIIPVTSGDAIRLTLTNLSGNTAVVSGYVETQFFL